MNMVGKSLPEFEHINLHWKMHDVNAASLGMKLPSYIMEQYIQPNGIRNLNFSKKNHHDLFTDFIPRVIYIETNNFEHLIEL